MKKNKVSMTWIVSLIMLLFAQVLKAQETGSFIENNEQNILFYFVLITLGFILIIMIYLSYMLVHSVQNLYRQKLVEQGIIKIENEELHWAENIAQSLNQAIPVAEEHTIDLGHEYDGIRELDNRLPPWWLYMFYATIVWSIAYMFYYHVLGAGPLQIDEYKAELALALRQKENYLEKFGASIDENSVTELTEENDLKKGKQIFATNCVACHGSLGEGGVGPNLTDEYWIHGGGIKNVFKVIKYGVPEKGMIAWQAQLKPEEIQKVGSYILSLKGTNPPNAKPAQGSLYQE